MKRLFDIVIATIGLIVAAPILLIFIVLIWLQDFASPFYIAPRARRRDRTFQMVKLRSMVKNADKLGGSSTSSSDRRITWVGRLLRKTKFDEVPQLWNVLVGDMSLVGPRPQVMRDVNLYTDEEYRLFDCRPGITDIASIVFADEGEILRGSENPDLRYNQIIRPWKSRLGLFYIRNRTLGMDVKLIFCTMLSAISRPRALAMVQALLRGSGAEDSLVRVAARSEVLTPYPPPGMTVVETRY